MAYNTDPFSDETLQLGEELTMLLTEERSESWKEMITSIDMMDAQHQKNPGHYQETRFRKTHLVE